MKKVILASLFLAFFSQKILAYSWEGPYSIQMVRWDVADAATGHSYLDFTVTGSERMFRYDWRMPGNDIEQAKVLLSILLSAHSGKRRIKVYGENYPGSTTLWKYHSLEYLD